MANIISVHVNQTSPATSEASIRQHRVLIDRPEAKGGEDKGAMGGELLLASLGGCFMSTLLAAVKARETDEKSKVENVRLEVSGTLGGNPSHFTAIQMDVSADYADEAALHKLVTIAERSCIVANTLKGAVELSVNVRTKASAA